MSRFKTIYKFKTVIGYGSSFTGIKKGISEKKDLDLILITDELETVSLLKRREIISRSYGRKVDAIVLTSKEFNRLKRIKTSIVNLALREGCVLQNGERGTYSRS